MAQINKNYTTKSGEVKTYNYFYADYKQKHKCTICDCIYTKNTKFNHVKTEHHKLAEKLRNDNPNITNIYTAICEYKYKLATSASSDEEEHTYKKRFKNVEMYNSTILRIKKRYDLNEKIPNLVDKIKNTEIPTINMHEKLKILLIKYPTNDLLKTVQYILSDKDKEYIKEQLLLNNQNETLSISNSTMPSTGVTCC